MHKLRTLTGCTALALTTAFALTGCTDSAPAPSSGPGAEADAPGSAETSDFPTAANALTDALGRIDADGDPVTVFFSLPADIADLPDEYSALALAGTHNLGPYADALTQATAVDLTAADLLVTAGEAPQQVTLAVGGQNGEAVRDAATESGWSGDPVLERELDLDAGPLSPLVPRLRPLGDSVALGGVSADLAAVNEGDAPLAEDSDLYRLAACLGDAVAGAITFPDLSGIPVAAGVAAPESEGGAARSVLCAIANDGDGDALAERIVETVEAEASPDRPKPYTNFFTVAGFGQSGALARVALDNVAGSRPDVIMQMLMARDLPLG